MKHLALYPLVAVLAACASSDASRAPSTASGGGAASRTSEAQLSQAATTPLSDLNLVRTEIPAVLSMARKAPYAMPHDRSCHTIAGEVQALDVALGADLDTPPTPSDPGMIERGAGAVGQAAVDAFRGAAEGVVPFRSWVRKITGADRYSREVAASVAAGTIRRAYLKGLGQAAGCKEPAAPRRHAAGLGEAVGKAD